MRRKCQVWNSSGEQCENPAVDYGEVSFKDGTVRIWMCAPHWDEHQKQSKAKKAK